MRAWKYGAKAPTENAGAVQEQLKLAHRYKNALIEIERNMRLALDSAATNEERAKIRARAVELKKAARATCGVYWGTYLIAEESVRRIAQSYSRFQAKREGRCSCGADFAAGTFIELETRTKRIVACQRCGTAIRFRRFIGEGAIAVQIQSTMPVTGAGVTGGSDTRVRVIGEGKRRELWLRIGGQRNAPLWAKFPIFWHRDIPADAQVRWTRVVATRVGTHTEWSAIFTVDTDRPLPAPKKGRVAIDVGWRRVDRGLRVAFWRDDSGQCGEVVLPESMLSGFRKVADLASIRKKSFLAARDALVAARDAGGVPPEVSDRAASVAQWESSARLAAFTLRWRSEVEAEAGMRFDEMSEKHPVLAQLEEWRKQERHLLDWQASQRQKLIARRRDLFRNFAVQIAKRREVVVKKLDLSALARRPDGDAKEPFAVTQARGQRQIAAVGELLDTLADAVRRADGRWIEALPKDTTTTCWSCGSREDVDARRLRHKCLSCGISWDIDDNAARNLLCAPERGTIAEGRTRASTGESKVATARKAAARRRSSVAGGGAVS